MYERDSVVSDHFFGRMGWRPSRLPSQRLALAILQDAIECVRKEPGIEHAAAAQWIMARDRDHLFSFENVCELLDFNAEAIRCKVLPRGHQPKPVK